jgi:small GTP-binding protein
MSRFSAGTKVVLLGDASVGKTSIMRRLCNGHFDTHTAPSIGNTLTRLGPHDDPFQIWDTAGQERYRSLAPVALRGAEIAILVFDITEQSSFENLNDWLDSLVNSAGDSIRMIIVVGNKSDLGPAARVSRQAAEAATESLRARISGVESVFVETSALTGDGISELQAQLAMTASLAKSTEQSVAVVEPMSNVEGRSKCCR